jgi:ribosomal protein S15P/S13E
VAKYAHLLLPFFDYFLLDGSHGFSSHGWKYMPLCIKTSGGSVAPLCAVWGLEEDTTSLLAMIDMLRQHLQAHGVDASAFSLRDLDAQVLSVLDSPAQAPSNPQVKDKYRTFIYPPKWEAFFVACMDPSVGDDALLALLPNIVEDPSFHCDSGTALLSLSKQLAWARTACAKHLEPNISSLNGNLKPLAMSLIYGREVSTHMAYDLRDQLLSTGCQTITADMRKWLTATFSTDAAMQVCVHKWFQPRTH